MKKNMFHKKLKIGFYARKNNDSKGNKLWASSRFILLSLPGQGYFIRLVTNTKQEEKVNNVTEWQKCQFQQKCVHHQKKNIKISGRNI